MTVARIAVYLMPILDCRFRVSIAMVKVAHDYACVRRRYRNTKSTCALDTSSLLREMLLNGVPGVLFWFAPLQCIHTRSPSRKAGASASRPGNDVRSWHLGDMSFCAAHVRF